jgi:hypothetical protein
MNTLTELYDQDFYSVALPNTMSLGVLSRLYPIALSR